MKPNRRSPTLPATPWRGAVLGACAGVLLAVLWGAPARWLASGVRWATQDRVQLRDARGTVWSGSAALTLTGGTGSHDARSLPSRLQWRLAWAWPGLSLTLSSACCTPTPLQWQVSAGWQRIELALQDQQSVWPMALLTGLGAPWNTLQAEGRLQWQSSGLRLDWNAGQWRWHGQSELQVQDLASRLSTLRPMGSYRLQFQGSTAQSPMHIQLDTLDGRLQLQGQGQWAGERWRFQGEASAAPEHEAALSNLLNVLGQRRGNKALMTMG